MAKSKPLELNEIEAIIHRASTYRDDFTQADFDFINANLAKSVEFREGRAKQRIKRQFTENKVALIDALNFTFTESYLVDLFGSFISDEELASNVSILLNEIFAIRVTEKRATGIFFYTDSYVLGDNYGFFAHGGNNDTIMVSLNGTGLSHCSENWQIRLYDFFYKAGYKAKITRIDLAYDDFEGVQFQLQKSLHMYNAGLFQNGKRAPLISMVGDWVTKTIKRVVPFISVPEIMVYFFASTKKVSNYNLNNTQTGYELKPKLKALTDTYRI